MSHGESGYKCCSRNNTSKNSVQHMNDCCQKLVFRTSHHDGGVCLGVRAQKRNNGGRTNLAYLRLSTGRRFQERWS